MKPQMCCCILLGAEQQAKHLFVSVQQIERFCSIFYQKRFKIKHNLKLKLKQNQVVNFSLTLKLYTIWN